MVHGFEPQRWRGLYCWIVVAGGASALLYSIVIGFKWYYMYQIYTCIRHFTWEWTSHLYDPLHVKGWIHDKVKTIILVKAMADFLLYHDFESQLLLLNSCGRWCFCSGTFIICRFEMVLKISEKCMYLSFHMGVAPTFVGPTLCERVNTR